MRNRIREIKAHNLEIATRDANQQNTGYQAAPIDYNKIKVGAKTLDDAILKLGDFKGNLPNLADKGAILKAIASYDLKMMRQVSELFYRVSGIYERIIKYMAFMYRYD